MSNSPSRFASVLLLAFTTTLASQAQNKPVDTRPPDTPVQTNLPKDPALNRKLPTVFIVGDSTARNGADLGWGDHLARYFDTKKINVANRAHAGRSSRTFINEGSWNNVLAEMKPGDFVLLQWGHNDAGDLGGDKPRGTIKDIGDESQDVPQITGPLAGKTETVHTYGWYLRKYIAETKAKGATPVLLTLTIRNVWTKDANGVQQVERDMGYDGLLKQLAENEHVAYVDMATIEADRLQAAGPEKTALLFPKDHTHTSAVGADLNAQSVVIALEEAKSPLLPYLKTAISLPAPTPDAAK